MTDKQHPPAHPEETDAARRRLLLRGGAVAGGLAAFAAGYGETLARGAKGLVAGTSGTSTASATRGNSLTPEFRIDPATGQLSTQPGQVVSPSSCLGCWTQCGVRLRVDSASNQILRIAGNPYHPLATTNPAPMETPVREVYAMLGGDNGLEGRATSCARGSAMLAHQTAPHRVLTPLKRVGPRGAGRWQSISLEQLVKEISEGGDLFGEGHVEGLAAIRDMRTLIDLSVNETLSRTIMTAVTTAIAAHSAGVRRSGRTAVRSMRLLPAVSWDLAAAAQPQRGQQGDRAAPAIAHGADLAEARQRVSRGAGDVHGALQAQGGDQRLPACDAVGVVVQFHAGFHRVEVGRRQHHVALAREAFRHGADVRIDTEDLLHHDQRATRRSGGIGPPGMDAAMRGLERQPVAHGGAPVVGDG